MLQGEMKGGKILRCFRDERELQAGQRKPGGQAMKIDLSYRCW